VEKKRMDWKQLGDSNAVKAVAAIVIALGALEAYETWDEPLNAEPEQAADTRPQLVTSFAGVRIGGKLADAPKALGPFDKQKNDPNAAKMYPDEEDHWQRNGRLRLAVRGGVVFSIGYPCADRDTTSVNHVACGDNSENVKRIMGDRLRVLCPKMAPDHPHVALAPFARAYDAVEFGTRYIVIHDKVTDFIVAEPREIESMVGFNWKECG
jgi:hypothetical protein